MITNYKRQCSTLLYHMVLNILHHLVVAYAMVGVPALITLIQRTACAYTKNVTSD